MFKQGKICTQKVMRMENESSYIIESVIGLLVVICGWFITRLISSNDTQHNQSTLDRKAIKKDIKGVKDTISDVSTKLDRVSYEIQSFRVSIEKELRNKAGLSPKTREDITALLVSFQKLKPKVDETYGKVIILGDDQKKSDKKLNTLYNAISRLVKSQKP